MFKNLIGAWSLAQRQAWKPSRREHHDVTHEPMLCARGEEPLVFHIAITNVRFREQYDRVKFCNALPIYLR
jgi:hypothetical protein